MLRGEIVGNVILLRLRYTIIQGDPNQNCPFLRAITQKLSIFDPMLVKQKCV